MADYAAEGAVAGAIAAVILGNLGPQAALPEELITVPVLGTIGGLLGSLIKKRGGRRG